MMSSYYVNKNAQSNGDHEVHIRECSFFPNPENAIFLGNFDSCRSAVAAAKKKYPKTNGCYHCVRKCHTS